MFKWLPAVEPNPLSSIARCRDEQSNSIWCDLLVLWVDPDLASLILPGLHGYQDQVQPQINNLGYFLEGEANKCWGESFGQNDFVGC